MTRAVTLDQLTIQRSQDLTTRLADVHRNVPIPVTELHQLLLSQILSIPLGLRIGECDSPIVVDQIL